MPDRALTFGRFRLNPRGGLTAGAREIKLTPKALALLSYLTERPGEVVTKDELFAAVWPWTAWAMPRSSPASRSCAARLKDDARQPRYIETLHRRGYRFIGKPAAAAGAPKARANGKAPRLPLPDKPSIAVLPFTNMSGDPEQEYFADGISEDLITALSRIRGCSSSRATRASSTRPRGRRERGLAQLGVRYVLEGSVRRTGNRIRMTAQLVDAASGGHHWAERYDRELADIFAVQDEITAAWRVPLSRACSQPKVCARCPALQSDLGAWEMVARAQTQFWRMTRADYEAAIGPLEAGGRGLPELRAGARHARPAPRIRIAHGMGRARRDGLRRAREHAGRAIALDELDPVGHMALGYCGRGWNGAPRSRSRRAAGRLRSTRIPRWHTRTSAT